MAYSRPEGKRPDELEAELRAILVAKAYRDSQRFYHVTPVENLPRILSEGLQPQRGDRSRAYAECDPAVFLFTSQAACETALGSWLGESFPEETDLAVLEVSLPAQVAIRSEVGYEVAAFGAIPSAHIHRLLVDATGKLEEIPMTGHTQSKSPAASDGDYPIEYRGYQIYSRISFVQKRNPVSGHQWSEPRDASGFIIEGPGANRAGTDVFQNEKAARDEIDFLIKFPSPVQPTAVSTPDEPRSPSRPLLRR